MRWTPGGDDQDIEDRRGASGDSEGGGGFNLGGFGPHLGIGGTLILLALSFVFKQNLFSVFSGGPSSDQPASNTAPVRSVPGDTSPNSAEGTEFQFIKFVFNDVQSTWDKLLPQQSRVPYHHAKLVLFRDATRSACGRAEEATGPFYCPGDEKVYVDLGFFDELKRRFGAPGEFAQAYVVAHEIGHHVQKILGIEGKVRQLQERNPGAEKQLSVRLELQADCFAGIWGKTSEQRQITDPNEVADGLRAAAAVGDDRLQKMATGRVSPESFTHGSSAQRVQWFRTGLDGGQVSACNTFGQ